MDFSFKIMYVELVGSCTDIALFEPKSFEETVNLSDHKIVAYVEFSFFIKEGTVNVELDDEGFITTIFMFFLRFYDSIKFVDLVNDSNSVSSVSKFSWLYYPYVTHFSLAGLTFFFLSLLTIDVCLPLFVVSQKTFILRIVDTLFYVESKRN